MYKKKTATLNQQIVQLSSELSQSTADCSMISQKVAELQAAHEQALQASEQSAEQLNTKLIEHEKFRNEVAKNSCDSNAFVGGLQTELAQLQIRFDQVSLDLTSTRSERDSTVSEMRQEIERLNLLHGDQSHTENRLVTAEAELTKERENNRLKSAKLENIIERLKEELNLKCSEITHLTYRCEQSEQQIQADTPFTEKQIKLLKNENKNLMAKMDGQVQEIMKTHGQLAQLTDERNYLDGECQRLNSLLMNFHNQTRSSSSRLDMFFASFLHSKL
jgi:chromosome segregation ATPase